MPKTMRVSCILWTVWASVFLLVRGRLSESRILRLDLQPTTALLEQKRQRRRLSHAKHGNRTFTYPKEWFHPLVRAVYAALHPSQPSTFDGTTNETHDELDSEYQEFVAFRHLSRYERSFRSKASMSLHPHWSGDYAHFSHLANDTSPRTSKRRLGKIDETLTGGQFNYYQGVPLFQGYGTHYAHIWVGTPVPQRQSVIVDTGSHFTAFPCSGCRECGQEHHTDPYFDPSRSQTFRFLSCPNECHEQAMCTDIPHRLLVDNVNTHNRTASSHSQTTIYGFDAGTGQPQRRCDFSQSYTEGSSWRGHQARDTIYAGGPDVLEAASPLDRFYSLDFMFGCLQEEKGLFVTQLADGIMGMSAHEATLTKQLYNQGKLEYNMFALCFRKELGTSQRGVSAGSMTLGGYSSTLDHSPMVFARNVQSYGWYTVHVENIYIARSGGSQFLFDDKGSREDIVRVDVDIQQVNSGKGVIVDSGTTDTYLNSKLLPEFVKTWQQVTGMEYTHGPIYLTQSQLKRLPTILVQCQAAQSTDTIATLSDTPVIGQVGMLDPARRSDVLLAIPATNYMEYNPTLNLYTSRLYFTETYGGVLGSNAMQGHNVLFDWQHGRIGFSQSSCSYDVTAKNQIRYSEKVYKQGSCVLGEPILTKPCAASVDVAVCEASDHPDNLEILGTEVWTLAVESPGSEWDSCQKVAAEWSQRQQNAVHLDQSLISCTLDGLCTESRSCQIPCLQALEYRRKSGLPPKDLGGVSQNNDCEHSYWSACDFNCKQSKIASHRDPIDGERCIESQRETRDCHIDACGRNDPCMVPFLVHAILSLEKDTTSGRRRSRSLGSLSSENAPNESEWTRDVMESFQHEFTRVSHLPEFSSIASNRPLFKEGDVEILAVRPWISENDDDLTDTALMDGPKGSTLQVVLQVSISNPKAHKILESKTSGGRHLLQEVGVLWKNLTQPIRAPGKTFTCDPADLYPLAKDAVELANGILEHQGFGERLVENFPGFKRCSVVSSWTIGTQVYDDVVNYYGPTSLTPVLLVLRVFCEVSLAFVVVSFFSLFWQHIRSYRHWVHTWFCRWWRGKPQRYQRVPTESRDGDDGLSNRISPGGKLTSSSPPRGQIELTLSRSSSGIHRKGPSTTTKRMLSSKASDH